MEPRIPFVDLAAQQDLIRPVLDLAISKVLDHGAYVMGPEVFELEEALRRRVGVPGVVSCASGTDALVMAMMALDVQPGDTVLVPDFTFAATAEAVALVGATPVFVDVDPVSFNISLSAVAEILDDCVSRATPRPVGVIAVDLFGLPADIEGLDLITSPYEMWTIVDGAQSFGALSGGRPSGSLGSVSCTSFFPAKPLGCYGDGGAVFTQDEKTAAVLRSIRVHGQGSSPSEYTRIGLTGRLDTLQAAVLLAKLRIFDDELEHRRLVAARYSSALAPVASVPECPPGVSSAWAQYTIKVEHRDQVAAQLAKEGIPSAIYYPIPLSQQGAYSSYPNPLGSPVASSLGGQVLSLPIHGYLDEVTQDWIVEVILRAATQT